MTYRPTILSVKNSITTSNPDAVINRNTHELGELNVLESANLKHVFHKIDRSSMGTEYSIALAEIDGELIIYICDSEKQGFQYWNAYGVRYIDGIVKPIDNAFLQQRSYLNMRDFLERKKEKIFDMFNDELKGKDINGRSIELRETK